MKKLMCLILVFFVAFLQAQPTYKITYERSFNGVANSNQDNVIVFTNKNFTILTTDQTVKNIKEFPIEKTYFNRASPDRFIQITSLDGNKIFGKLDSISLGEQNFIFLEEEKRINGYTCKRARTNINSNSIDLWYTTDLGVKGAPSVLGQNLGLVLEMSVNDKFQFKAISIEKLSKNQSDIDLSFLDKINYIDNLTYKDILWKSRFITVPVFKDEVIRYSDESKSNDSILRFAKGTVIFRKVKFPNFDKNNNVFIDLISYSLGDAYDRTGSVFMIPADAKKSFLDGCINGIETLPIYQNENLVKYRGVMLTKDYVPLVELMRFITPFGINKYNTISIKNMTWHDKVFYRQDISEYRSLLSNKEVYVGAFIGNYDSKGHYIDLNFTIHPEEKKAEKDTFVMPLFNTLGVLEMEGQGYSTMFSVDRGLEVKFSLNKDVKNAKLRFITTGHGGWENGDEFVPKPNTIYLNGEKVYSFVPWRTDCGSFRLFNPASGNFNNGLSSSDYSRSNWCPGTVTNPEIIYLGDLSKGDYTIQVKIPQGSPEGKSFSHWNVSGVLIAD